MGEAGPEYLRIGFLREATVAPPKEALQMTLSASTIRNTFSRASYAAVAKEYAAALDWMRGIGLRIEPTRAARYERVLAALVAIHRDGKAPWDDLPFKFGEVMAAFGEVNELLRIYRGMKGVADLEFVAKLRRVISGRFGRPEAKVTDPARDYSFELMVASRFRLSGLAVSLRGLADLTVNLGDQVLHVECKRLRSLQGVRKNVRDAAIQLGRRYGRSKGAEWGLIALSITDGLNPEQMILPKPTQQEVQTAMARIVDGFIARQCRLWQQVGDDRLLGAMVEFATVGVLESEKLPITCVETGFNNAHGPDTEQTRILHEVAQRIGQGSTSQTRFAYEGGASP